MKTKFLLVVLVMVVFGIIGKCTIDPHDTERHMIVRNNKLLEYMIQNDIRNFKLINDDALSKMKFNLFSKKKDKTEDELDFDYDTNERIVADGFYDELEEKMKKEMKERKNQLEKEMLKNDSKSNVCDIRIKISKVPAANNNNVGDVNVSISYKDVLKKLDKTLDFAVKFDNDGNILNKDEIIKKAGDDSSIVKVCEDIMNKCINEKIYASSNYDMTYNYSSIKK